MGDKTSIAWTDATFNPWWGCTKISPGCDNCYAEGIAKRFAPGIWGINAQRREFSDAHWSQPVRWNSRAMKSGQRMRVFCASMADVFDNDAPEGARGRLWALIESTPSLDWQLLTKRIGNVRAMVPPRWMSGGFPPHVWLCATVVNQEEADREIPKLLLVPARIHGLSCEPLLSAIDLRLTRAAPLWASDGPSAQCRSVERFGLDWVIVGGESGRGARPMHPDWARSLRDQCAAAGVPFLFKQWGAWIDGSDQEWRGIAVDRAGRIAMNGVDKAAYPKGADGADGWTMMHRAGKKAAGRMLDGRTWDEYPT